MVQLRSAEQLTLEQQPLAAWRLSRSAQTAPRLKEELPDAARNYRNPLRAFRRLGYVGTLSERGKLVSDIIYGPQDHHRPIGMASAWQHRTADLPQAVTDDGVELSYWHSNLEESTARQAGVDVIRQLASTAVEYYDLDQTATIWAVALHDDRLKDDVYQRAGLVPCGATQPYDIDDPVTTPRQLYVATPVTILG